MTEEENDNSIYQNYQVDTAGHTMIVGCYDMFQRMKAEASQLNHGAHPDAVSVNLEIG